MRKTNFKFAVLLCSIAILSCTSADKNKNQISFSGAFALYPLNIKWSEEYKKLHPETSFNIQAGGAGKGLTDALTGNADVGMFSRELNEAELSKDVWYIALAKDAVLPVVNASNPFIDLLKKNGLTHDQFENIFINNTPPTWNELLNRPNITPQKINIYTRSDASGAAESWAAFFNAHQENLKGLAVLGDPGVAHAVQNDSNGIGFNNTHYVYDTKTGAKLKNIEVLPLDINSNGTIDSTENFYNNLDEVLNAVLAGKYPSPPVRDLYFVCKQKPTDKAILDYFKWVLTDGQQFVKSSGFVPLPQNEINASLKKLE